MRWPAVFLAFFPLAPSPAGAADSFYERTIAERNGPAPCYAMIRDEAFFAAHPSALVQRFFLRHSEAEDLTPPRSFDLAFGFTLSGSSDSYASEAGCGEVGDGVACSAEGDGGGFALAGDGEGLRLTIDQRLMVEGMRDFGPNLAERVEDRVLMLRPSPAEDCSIE